MVPRIKHLSLVALACTFALVSSAPDAQADILQPNQSGITSLSGAGYGQTFTAETSDLFSIDFYYGDYNVGLGSGVISIDLYAGTGFGGPLLHTVTRDLAGMAEGMQKFVFGHLTTTIGSVYTFRVKSASGRGALGDATDTYAGGTMLLWDGSTYPGRDMTFAIDDSPETVPPTAVPEPTSMVLVATGVLGLIARRRAVA
jgi:hypothetical protein